MINKSKKVIGKFNWQQIIGSIFIVSGIGGAMSGYLIHKYLPHRNIPPTAQITHSALEGHLPHKISFDGISSKDPERDVLKYTWIMDDQIVSTERSFTHDFHKMGIHNIKLIIEDSDGLKDDDAVFAVIHPPENIKTVKDALTYYTYELGYTEPITKTLIYVPIKNVAIKNLHCFVEYDYKGRGNIHLLISEFDRRIFGIWKDVRGSGDTEFIFTSDFKEAKGWWNYNHSRNRKYKFHLRIK